MMKRSALNSLVILVLALGCNSESGVFAPGDVTTVAFSVPDMMCEVSCAPKVREILAAQPGVKDVQVELETKTATVTVDEEKFDADAAIAALVDVQFVNTTLAATPKAPPQP